MTYSPHWLAAVVLVVAAATQLSLAQRGGDRPRPPEPVTQARDGSLVYEPDAQGNRVPDFSHCGYMGGDADIPDVPVVVVVPPADGDDGARIQAAIDYVASLPGDRSGVRGAVLLAKGRYEVAGQLIIRGSGVVLRGSGMGDDGTVLVATGQDRRTLIRIVGVDDRTDPFGKANVAAITDEYVPVGATELTLARTAGLKVGNEIMIRRPSTQEWSMALGTAKEGGWMGDWMSRWKPGLHDITWDRVITAIDGNRITIDAPITMAIESRFGGAEVRPYRWPGRINQVGVENIRLVSATDKDLPKDEAHSWCGVTMDNAANAWVRQVTFTGFAGSAVAVWETCKHVTVADCISLEPVSEDGGYRRHTFFTMGQMTLFLRCWSEHGRHDFSVGYCAAGPNAFVYCQSVESLADSGPVEDWACGVLYDNVKIDGGGLDLNYRRFYGDSAGFSAANCVLWQCAAARMHCVSPPTATNWGFGCWADRVGNAIWRANDGFVNPQSLYQGQLADRLGREAASRVGDAPRYPRGGSSPTIEQAAEAVALSSVPAETVLTLIERAQQRRPIPTDAKGAKSVDELPPCPAAPPAAEDNRLALRNGWLVCGDKLLTGGRTGGVWWRGSIAPPVAARFRDCLTRFVPGRVGVGYTDDLDQVTDQMQASRRVVRDYHYGLWYDRRRDDHLRVRRADGNVWPPFYEQPFARSGQGTAWDGLSKYDLTRYAPWYWLRLRRFADLADRKGLVLLHQNYFQHNIIEAGAHWADCPWRSANNINDTGFPEPPPFAGDKRIYQAHLFYDTTHPVRRALHRAYIRQCLNNFVGNTNVIQSTSAEFTGPREFVEFWLDTIAEWQRETGNDAMVALSCTKDVQDAILADPARAKIVDMIDIRYWHYQADGSAYAPPGGKNMAPRQHARQMKPRPSSFEQVVRAVREYRTKFPDKAVIYSAEGGNAAWAVLIGGGSIPDVRNLTDSALLAAIPKMAPANLLADAERQWCLAQPGSNYLVYTAGGNVTLDLSAAAGEFAVNWIDTDSGGMVAGKPVNGGGKVTLTPPGRGLRAVWLTKKTR